MDLLIYSGILVLNKTNYLWKIVYHEYQKQIENDIIDIIDAYKGIAFVVKNEPSGSLSPNEPLCEDGRTYCKHSGWELVESEITQCCSVRSILDHKLFYNIEEIEELDFEILNYKEETGAKYFTEIIKVFDSFPVEESAKLEYYDLPDEENAYLGDN